MSEETVAEASGGTLFAQVALLILGYAWPAAPQWARAVVAIVVGVLSALAGELRGGLATIDLLAGLTILGQGGITAALALGLFAGIGAAQEKRALAGEAGRHGTAP
jgi:hypothetical protein